MKDNSLMEHCYDIRIRSNNADASRASTVSIILTKNCQGWCGCAVNVADMSSSLPA